MPVLKNAKQERNIMLICVSISHEIMCRDFWFRSGCECPWEWSNEKSFFVVFQTNWGNVLWVSTVIRVLTVMCMAAGLLCHAPPTRRGHFRNVEVLGCVYSSLPEYFAKFRHILLLEITQECNLRCKYCVYGEHYPHSREHGVAHAFEDIISFVLDFRASFDLLWTQLRSNRRPLSLWEVFSDTG